MESHNYSQNQTAIGHSYQQPLLHAISYCLKLVNYRAWNNFTMHYPKSAYHHFVSLIWDFLHHCVHAEISYVILRGCLRWTFNAQVEYAPFWEEENKKEVKHFRKTAHMYV